MSKNIIEIRPDPIITSTVEIRFASNINDEDVLSTFYGIFGKNYPKVTDKGVPKQLKAVAPEFRNQADYILSNSDYSISVGKNVIAFENVGGYKLWKNYYEIITENLKVFDSLKRVSSINRIGVRYASIFDAQKVEDVLNLNFSINHDNYLQTGDIFRTLLAKDNIQLHLQVIQKVQASKGNEKKEGLYIDIDASQEVNLPDKFDTDLYKIIDKLHMEEKKLFEFLIKNEFLNKLEVKYK